MRTLCKGAVLILVFGLLSAAAGAQCRDNRGTWSAEPAKDHAELLQFRFTCSQDIGSTDRPLAPSELQGLDPAAVHGQHVAVKFRLAREAGTLQFEGSLNEGVGYGEFTFTANPEFLAAMKEMGYPIPEDKPFVLTLIDMTRAYVQELRSLGFNPDLDKLVEARIFNVNRDQVNGLKTIGVSDLPLDKLIQYRIFHITPEYIQQMRAAFPGISVEKMTEMRIHNVTPAFASEMSRLGYSGLNVDQLIAFRIHNVTPDFITEMDKLGFKKLDADRLVQFRIFNVNANQIQDLAKEGYKDLSADDLVAFRIHHIDAEFIEKVKKAGHPHPTPNELVEFKIMGLRRRSAEL